MSGVLVDEQALAQLTAELSVTKQQLAEARAALAECKQRLSEWRAKYAAALKAAREEGNGNP